MAMPVISAKKEEITTMRVAATQLKEISMERFNRLARSVWDCKYHIVWIPKYRREELYGVKRRIVVDTIKQWSRIKGIDMIEADNAILEMTPIFLYDEKKIDFGV